MKQETKIKKMKTFLNISEVERIYQISKPTLYKLIKTGKLDLYKLGGKSFVDQEQFNSLFVKSEPRILKANIKE
jgi:predicted DNA-binding transcriptional regulator AlpA